MPKKKASQGNAFYWYMQDLMPELRREGRAFPNGMQDVVPIAHPRFKALTPEEKAYYEKKAKNWKAQMRGVEGDKYRQDNVGNIISERVDKHVEEAKRKKAEEKMMKARWSPGQDVIDDKLYFIDFQTLCRTEEGDYLPCEIGMVEYSMKDGISKTLQRFIDPKGIPLGYRFTCQQNSDDTHKIPISSFELADDNYRGLWIQMENFVNPNGEKREYPPIFCMSEDTEKVEYCTQWIHANACVGIPNRLKKIFSIETMVHTLSGHLGGKPVSETQCADLLTTTAYDYESNTRCAWHEEAETKYCSLAICRRYAYAISDSMCNVFDFDLIPNKHIPSRAAQPVQVIRPEAMATEHQFVNRGPASTSSASGPFAATDIRLKDQTETLYNQDEEEDKQTMRRPNLPSIASQFGTAPWGKPRGVNAAAASHAGGPAEYGRMEPMVSKKKKKEAEEHLGQYNAGDSGDDDYFGPADTNSTPAWSTQSTGSVAVNASTVDIGDSEEFPTLGGAPAKAKPQPRFAARSGPPPAQGAPRPPTSWHQAPTQPAPAPWGQQPTQMQQRAPWGAQTPVRPQGTSSTAATSAQSTPSSTWGPQGSMRAWGPSSASSQVSSQAPVQPIKPPTQPTQPAKPATQPNFNKPVQTFGGIGRGRGAVRAGAAPPGGGAARAGAAPPGAGVNQQMSDLQIN